MNSESTRTSESQRYIARVQAQQKQRYAKAIGLIIVAVLAGVVIGAGCSILYLRSYYHRVPPKRAAIGESIFTQMNSVVNLTQEETPKIKDIVSAHLAEVDEIRRASSHNTRQVFGRMNEEIETIIGEDRFKLWEEYKLKNWGNYKNRQYRRHHRQGDRKSQDGNVAGDKKDA